MGNIPEEYRSIIEEREEVKAGMDYWGVRTLCIISIIFGVIILSGTIWTIFFINIGPPRPISASSQIPLTLLVTSFFIFFIAIPCITLTMMQMEHMYDRYIRWLGYVVVVGLVGILVMFLMIILRG